MDALQLLREDHKYIKELFKQFEDADDSRTKGRIVGESLTALEVHAEIEEKIFYPAVRKETDPDDGEMDEAEEEHHVVKLLIAELRNMKPTAERYDAKFTVLSENVKHHIDEEESEMLLKAAELGMPRLNELGAAMERRKLQLVKAPASKLRSRTSPASANGKRPTAARPKTAARAKATPKRTVKAVGKSISRTAKAPAKSIARAAKPAKRVPRKAVAARSRPK
jgi:hemerythrin-like domain-containing protein